MFSVLWVSLSVYLISSLLQLRKKSMAAVVGAVWHSHQRYAAECYL